MKTINVLFSIVISLTALHIRAMETQSAQNNKQIKFAKACDVIMPRFVEIAGDEGAKLLRKQLIKKLIPHVMMNNNAIMFGADACVSIQHVVNVAQSIVAEYKKGHTKKVASVPQKPESTAAQAGKQTAAPTSTLKKEQEQKVSNESSTAQSKSKEKASAAKKDVISNIESKLRNLCSLDVLFNANHQKVWNSITSGSKKDVFVLLAAQFSSLYTNLPQRGIRLPNYCLSASLERDIMINRNLATIIVGLVRFEKDITKLNEIDSLLSKLLEVK